MDKSEVIKSLEERLRIQYERTLDAVESASEAATGEDTKAENKYDTRGLEASYLAAGQAEQAEELAQALHRLEQFEFRDFEFDEAIEAGAIVEVEVDNEIAHYLLAPAGGGLVLSSKEGMEITVLGPASPLREKLVGLCVGDRVENPEGTILEIF